MSTVILEIWLVWVIGWRRVSFSVSSFSAIWLGFSGGASIFQNCLARPSRPKFYLTGSSTSSFLAISPNFKNQKRAGPRPRTRSFGTIILHALPIFVGAYPTYSLGSFWSDNYQ